uniref:porin n=1 Tax=Thaumasiovibrio occultus TaxID=1891184 RepID=UPI000B351A5F|nr:porin [Thaumasiovibrio occultus]
MKKTTLALALPALMAAGAASASINLYDNKGLTVDVSGAAEVQVYKNQDYNSTERIRLDDGDLEFNVAAQISDNLDAIAGIAFKFEGSDAPTPAVQNDELYVGFAGNFGELTIGRMLLIADDLGNTKDYELGGDTLGFPEDQAGQAVKYIFDNGQFYTGVSYRHVSASGENDPSAESIDGRVGARFADLDIAVYFYDGSADASNLDQTGYNVQADYVFGDWSFAASYGNVESKSDDIITDPGKEDNYNTDVIAVSADYTLDQTTFAGGYTLASYDRYEAEDVDFDVSSIYFNVTQKFHSKVKGYAEVAFFDHDSANAVDDVGYVLGMEVKF